MKTGFTYGIIIGSIVGATVSMMANENIDIHRARRCMMRYYKSMCKKSRRMMHDIAHMFH